MFGPCALVAPVRTISRRAVAGTTARKTDEADGIYIVGTQYWTGWMKIEKSGVRKSGHISSTVARSVYDNCLLGRKLNSILLKDTRRSDHECTTHKYTNVLTKVYNFNIFFKK